MRFDILNLQYRLPAAVLRWPYEVLNRFNRNRLNSRMKADVANITHEDYQLVKDPDQGLDLFYVLSKK
jgi:hypothetical protein